MATTLTASQKAAQKRLTKAEFKLVSQSQASDLKTIPRDRIRKARARTVELVKRHRKAARAKADDKVGSREVNFRLRSMEKVLERFDRILNKERLEKRKAKAARGKKSMTEQPKMHLNLAEGNHLSSISKKNLRAQNKRTLTQTRLDNSASSVGKRVAGFSSARSRKGQVARDRGNSSEG